MAKIGPVIITAAGEGTRIRSMMNSDGFPPDYPKHLLPTGNPNGETLLGRIIRQASVEPISQPPIIYATETSKARMQGHPDVGLAEYSTEQFGFSMDPLYYKLRRTGARVLGCAGDFYSDFTWSDYLAAHEQSGMPMSVLAGSAAGSEKSAIFDIHKGVIIGFRRPTISKPDEHKNIGVYIIDPHSEILNVMDELLPENPKMAPTDDAIFTRMVSLGLVGAITKVGTRHYNINSALEYAAMVTGVSENSVPDYVEAEAS